MPENTRARSNHQYRVPDLQLDLMTVDGDQSGTKLHSNREVMHWLEAFVCELEQQAALAHACVRLSVNSQETRVRRQLYHRTASMFIPTCVSNDDVLEKIRVAHCCVLCFEVKK